MATGTLWYWNGISGWIKQSGVEELCTCQARDVLVLKDDTTGDMYQGCNVEFTTEDNRDPWLARTVAEAAEE